MAADRERVNEPKVSVIVPVLNVKPYLKDCLDSILAQTLTDIEILCGDGGSTDGSLELLREYERRDDRVTVLSKPGSGYGQSVNDCARMAQGKYIGIVESDDLIRPDMYELLYEEAEKKDLDWVRGDIYFYYSAPGKEPIRRYEKIIIGDHYGKVLDPQKDCRPYRSRLRTWSGIYRRSFLEANGITHNETPGAAYQDVGFYLKTLYHARRVAFVHKGLYMWRQDNPASSSHFGASGLAEKVFREWALNRTYLSDRPGLGAQAVSGFYYREFLSFLWAIDCTDGEVRERTKAAVRQSVEQNARAGLYSRPFFTAREWRQLRRFLKTGETVDARRKLHLWMQRRLKKRETI